MESLLHAGKTSDSERTVHIEKRRGEGLNQATIVLALNISSAEAELKQKPGHFEIDTIFGKDEKSFLLTLVDKALKTIIIRKLPNRRAKNRGCRFQRH
ncbi:hypothetical protein EWM60_18605 [Candidatus Erwinia dacicola]|nr:hypothetical protein [Candidatus Erwinia dacicola]